MKRRDLVVSMMCLLSIIALGCAKKEGDAKTGAESDAASAAAPAAKQIALVSRNPSQNATPFGLEVGYATLAGFKEKYPNAKVLKTVPNNVSGGTHLQVEPSVLGMDGLHDVSLSFDKSNILSCVVMVLDKDPKGITSTLSEKYKLVSSKIDDFMNYGNALLEKGDSEIRIESEHVSHVMIVVYGSKQFLKEQDQAKAAESQQHQNEQKNKL